MTKPIISWSGPTCLHLGALPDWRLLSFSTLPRSYWSFVVPTTLAPSRLIPYHLRQCTFKPSTCSRLPSVESCRIRGPNKHLISAACAEMLSLVDQHDRIKDATRRLFVLVGDS